MYHSVLTILDSQQSLTPFVAVLVKIASWLVFFLVVWSGDGDGDGDNGESW